MTVTEALAVTTGLEWVTWDAFKAIDSVLCFPVATNVRFSLPFVTHQVFIGHAEGVLRHAGPLD